MMPLPLLGQLRNLAGRRLLGLPVLALLATAVIDRGPDGTLRLTGIYLALTAWDPFTWRVVGQSAALALTISLAAMFLGTALASALELLPTRIRKPLAILASLPMAVPPLCGAISLGEVFPGAPAAWEGIVWVNLTLAVPWVARSVARALNDLDPGGTDAARLAGAGPWRIRRDLLWPLVRPAAARAAATVFVLALLEPCAPLVLGLRGTLPFQILEAASRPDERARAASLALLAIACSWVGHACLIAWGGREITPTRVRSPRPTMKTSFLASFLAFLACLTWILLSFGPTLSLLATASRLRIGAGGELGISAASFHELVQGLALSRVLGRSFAYGGAAAALAWVVSRILGGVRWRPIPPLATATGFAVALSLLVIPRFEGPVGAWAARLLTPGRLASGAWIGALTLVYYPLAGRLGLRQRQVDHRPRRDAALVLGASRREARRVTSGPRFAPRALVAWLLVAGLAATDTCVPLLFCRSAQSLTLGPEILWRSGEPGEPGDAASWALFLVFLHGLCVGSILLWERRIESHGRRRRETRPDSLGPGTARSWAS